MTPAEPLRSSFLLLAGITLACLFAYVPAALHGWWISDDHSNVYYPERQEVCPSLEALLERSPSSARILVRPLITIPASYLGNTGSHLFAIGKHLLCGLLAGLVLLRLRLSPHSILVGLAFFLLAPWATQPVLWWTASVVMDHTLLFLLALLLYLVHLKHSGWRRHLLLVLSLATVLLSLFIYELWLFGFLAFWGIEYFRLRQDTPTPLSAQQKRLVFMRCALVLLPYLLWFLAYLLTVSSQDQNHPVLSPLRIFIVFFSVHLRICHWFTDTPWLNAMGNGLSSLASPLPLALFTFSLACLAAYSAKRKKHPQTPERQTWPAPSFLFDGFVLSWSFFAASRLVFLLQGGVATHTRHSYGAALAAGIAASFLCHFLSSRQAPALSPNKPIFLLLLLMTLTTAGLAHHKAATAQAEREAWHFLTHSLADLPPDTTVLIAGDPTGTKGELPFFEEDDGTWLRTLLKRSLNRPVDIHVGRSVETQDQQILLHTYSGATLTFPRSTSQVFIWQDKELQPSCLP